MSCFVEKEQVERAKEIDVLDYIFATEPHNIKRVGNGFRLKDHDSLSVASGKWYWHSRGIGGKNAIGYLTEVRGYSFVDAVCLLLNERAVERSFVQKVKQVSKTKPFILPLRNENNRRIIAYLQSRGIDKGVISDCINRGDLYETRRFHNCCFIGRDEGGKARYAALRGTLSNFKQDTDGSNKSYGFVVHPDDLNSKEIAVFESPIDALSHKTLCKIEFIPPFNGWRISLGGSSITALEQFLKNHDEIKHCIVCTDADEAGNNAALRVAKLSKITSARSPPICGNDWNDCLKIIQKSQRMQGKNKSYERG